MKTELETRISELEEELSRLDPGSETYECVAKDHATLVKSWNDIRKTDAEIRMKEKSFDLEKDKFRSEAVDRANRTEIEKKSKSWIRRVGEITLGTLVPIGGYMIWEETGHLVKGQWQKWIKRF